MKSTNHHFYQNPSLLRDLLTKVALVAFIALFCVTAEAAKGGNGGGKPGGGSALPEISSISPTSGSVDGGTSVTINGKNFSKQATVTFGGLAVTAVDVRNGKRMNVVTPASPSGVVDVTVNNPDGNSVTLVGGFTYEGQQAPAAPSALNAAAGGSSQINLSWTDNAINEDGFVIERSLDGSSFSQIDSVGSNTQAYSDSGLTTEVTYYYRVAAFNLIGNSSYSNAAQATTPATSPVVAFPGAEGFGTNTAGGRGGQVIEVTNLSDSGAGSFRAAIETAGARIVVFTTGGTIELLTPVEVDEPFLTIAAQTAPGDGIALKGEGLIIHTHDVIVRSLRIRIGDLGTPTNSRDGINISTTGAVTDIYNVVIDHSSVAWAIDENIATWESSSNSLDIYDVTIQWSITSEALHDSIHIDEGASSTAPHSMGLLLGRNSENISVHHNLLAHNNSRNPRLDGIMAGEVINNLIYGWGKDAPTRNAATPAIFHVLNNFYHSGPISRQDEIYIDDDTQSGSSFCVEGNLTDDVRVSPEPFPSRILNRNNYPIDTFPQFTASGISMDPTLDVFNLVLNNAGAITPVRDAVDTRVVTQVTNRTGSIIDSQAEVGGWPVYNPGTALTDSDHDGMPDSWETLQGLDPFDTSDRNNQAPSGYTWIEEYINGLIPMP
ncbi:MAG: hypothetical protein GQ538_06215 [Xanthomonadales bacterium]|nr:hypothetical protein [Xanthomonadales bacterium]